MTLLASNAEGFPCRGAPTALGSFFTKKTIKNKIYISKISIRVILQMHNAFLSKMSEKVSEKVCRYFAKIYRTFAKISAEGAKLATFRFCKW